jgi:predicted peroxiredoxin
MVLGTLDPFGTRTRINASNPESEGIMAEAQRELVILMTRGIDHELSSVGFTIACGGITAGLKVCIFLTSAAVDVVRKRGADMTHVPPLDPLKAQIEDFIRRGGQVVACTPCVKARGYAQEDLVDGVTIAGASVIHEKFKSGAASLSF